MCGVYPFHKIIHYRFDRKMYSFLYYPQTLSQWSVQNRTCLVVAFRLFLKQEVDVRFVRSFQVRLFLMV